MIRNFEIFLQFASAFITLNGVCSGETKLILDISPIFQEDAQLCYNIIVYCNNTQPDITQSAAQSADQNTAQSTDQTTYQSTAQSTDQSIAQSTDQSTDESTAQSTDQSAAQSTDQSTAQSSDQSTAESTDQSIAKSTDQSTDESTAQSTDQSTAQSTDQSTAQSTEQSIAQSTVKQTITYNSHSKNLVSQIFITKMSTLCEIIIFNFKETKCTDYSIIISVLQFAWINRKETIEKRTHFYETPLKKIANDISDVTELVVMGKYFMINVQPVLDRKGHFYELKLYCHGDHRTVLHHCDIPRWNNRCRKAIFLEETNCSGNEYDIELWKWNSDAQKMANTEKSMFFSKLTINHGEELSIYYRMITH